MLVVIYETKFSSPFSILVAAVTFSPYSHLAIHNRDVLYDTTISRGKFSVAEKVAEGRRVTVFDIEGDCQEWIDAHLNTRYDYVGLIGWPIRIAMAGLMFCFNVGERSLSSIGVFIPLGWRKDGGSIINKLLDQGYEGKVMMGKQFNERYLKKDTL